MDWHDNILRSVASHLKRLDAQIEGIESLVRQDMTSNSHSFSQPLSDVRAQIGVTVEQIKGLLVVEVADLERLPGKDNRHWAALRGAVRTYRHQIERRTEEGSREN